MASFISTPKGKGYSRWFIRLDPIFESRSETGIGLEPTKKPGEEFVEVQRFSLLQNWSKPRVDSSGKLLILAALRMLTFESGRESSVASQTVATTVPSAFITMVQWRQASSAALSLSLAPSWLQNERACFPGQARRPRLQSWEARGSCWGPPMIWKRDLVLSRTILLSINCCWMWVKLGMAVGAGLLALSLLRLAKHCWRKSSRSPEEEQEEEVEKDRNYMLTVLVNSIAVNYGRDKKWLQNSCVIELALKAGELARSEAVQFIRSERKERRIIRMQSSGGYLLKLQRFQDEFRQIVDQALAELLSELNLSEQLYNESALFHIHESEDFKAEFLNTSPLIRQRIKAALPRTRHLSLQELKDVLKYQLGYLKDHRAQLREVRGTRLPPGRQMQVLELMCADAVWERFGVEEEDLVDGLAQHPGNEELESLLGRIEEELQSVLGEQAAGDGSLS